MRTLKDVWEGPDPSLPHVLLVVDQFPKAPGGGERTVLRLAELLPQYGFRASVLTFSVHPESSVLAATLPFPIYLLPLVRTYDLTALQGALAIGRFLREQKVLLVQTFFESSDLWAGLVTKACSRARLIWSRRDMGILRSSKHRLAYRLLAGLPDRVFAVSERVRNYCIVEDRIEPSRVSTIYNGLDLPELCPTPAATHPLSVTTIGNIRKVKGHDILIRAAAIVLERYSEIQFSIGGEVLEADYFQSLLFLLKELGISHQVHFCGSVSNPPQHLQQADIFVLPSRSEGFSNAILEAMSCALPVIATDVGGNAEAVLERVTGFLIDSEDPVTLAARICELAENRALAREMGSAGRVRVEAKFSTGAMMEQVTAAYRKLIAG